MTEHARSQMPSRVARFAAVIALATAAVGCGSDTTATATAKPTGPTFLLSEFVVKLDRATLPHGKVTITANNAGGEEHELVLVKAAALSDLPTKPDGSVDEDKIPESDKAGEIDHVRAHESKSATLDLAPGTYVAFCNIIDGMGASGMMPGHNTPSTMMGGASSGHVHYASGMHQIVTVEG